MPNNLIDQPEKAMRRKIWELDNHYHCSVIGTCLTLKELRSIARKCKLDEINTATNYDLHHWFVMASTEISAVSKMLNKRLEKKFTCNIRKVSQLQTDAELRTYWQQAKSSGDVAGPYWAIVTHPTTNEQILNQIYGDIHMLSHLAGASCRVEQQTMKKTQTQNIVLQRTLGEIRKKVMTLQLEKEKIQKKLIAEKSLHILTQKKLTTSQDRWKKLSQNTENNTLQNLIDNISSQLSQANKENKQAQKTILEDRKTIRQLERQTQRLTTRLERQIENWWQQPTDQVKKTCPISGEDIESGCTNPDLCGQKILYVGGRITSCPHLKSATETINGCFLYHDGGLEENPHKLTTALQQADAVFFPTDCVSHEASNRVKEFCNRAQKPLVQLKSSGISSFKKSLNQFATQYQSGDAL